MPTQHAAGRPVNPKPSIPSTAPKPETASDLVGVRGFEPPASTSRTCSPRRLSSVGAVFALVAVVRWGWSRVETFHDLPREHLTALLGLCLDTGMSTYTRITFRDGEKRRTVILRNVDNSDRLVSGIEVDRHGDEIAPRGFDQRLRIIERELVASETALVMDMKYGELVAPARRLVDLHRDGDLT
jgi:hypothetical protein